MKFIHDSKDSPELRAIIQAKLDTILPANNGGPIKEIISYDRVNTDNIHDYTPIGGIKFYENVIGQQYKIIPKPVDYPEELLPFLNRSIRKGYMRDAKEGEWIKPVQTKDFDSFIMKQGAIDYTEPCWICENIPFTYEWRVYILEDKILGYSQYDELEEDRDLDAADMLMIEDMMKSWVKGKPIAYALDVGIQEKTNKLTLIEVNDAWATGYYKGTIKRIDYARWLYERWMSLRVYQNENK